MSQDRILPVWTKADLAGNGGRPGGLRVSGLTGAGLPALIVAIRRRLEPEGEEFRVRIPYTSPRAIAAARAAFRVLDEQDRGDGLWMRLSGDRSHLRPLMRFGRGRLEERFRHKNKGGIGRFPPYHNAGKLPRRHSSW